MKKSYILSWARTPQGSFLGSLSKISAPKLGSVAIRGCLDRAQFEAEKVDEVFMGNVISAGVGQAPARQAALGAGLSEAVSCTTINKVCGSGMEALRLGVGSQLLGSSKAFIAGGMENMSMAPHLMENSRSGTKFGNTLVRDTMIHDGLWDAYSKRVMGECAEDCLKELKISREEQDNYAAESFKRAQIAQSEGYFSSEIVPVVVPGRKEDIIVDSDEGPNKVKFEKIPRLKPIFDSKNGSITAANASSINDGAAALLIGDESFKDQAKFEILSFGHNAHNPTWFPTAPVDAMKRALERANLSVGDIDYFEVNEAFAMVPLYAQSELKLDPKKVNIWGSGISLGHPLGTSGARILVTLCNILETKKADIGMAGICIGGGEGLSVIIRRIH